MRVTNFPVQLPGTPRIIMSFFQPLFGLVSPESNLVVSERKVVYPYSTVQRPFHDHSVVVQRLYFNADIFRILFQRLFAVLHFDLERQFTQKPLTNKLGSTSRLTDRNEFFPVKITLFREGGGNH